MTWSADTAIAPVGSIGAALTDIGSVIDMSAAQYTWVQIGVRNDGTGTISDQILVGAYATLDGVTFDDVPFQEFRITGSASLLYRPWIIRDAWQFQIKAKVIGAEGTASGISDSYTVGGSYRTFS